MEKSMGFTKLRRQDVRLFEANLELLGLYSYLLSEAAWGSCSAKLRSPLKLEKGQYAISLRSLAKKVGRRFSGLKRDLLILEQMGLIAMSPLSAQGVVISVTPSPNLVPVSQTQAYRESVSAFPTGSAKDTKLRFPPEAHCVSHRKRKLETAFPTGSANSNPSLLEKKNVLKNKERRDEENGVKNAVSATPLGSDKLTRSLDLNLDSFSQEDKEIALKWLAFAKSEMTWGKAPSAWTVESFAEGIVRLKKATDLNHTGMLAVLDFVKNDDFWAKNALSPNSLMKKSRNGIRKIDNVLLQIKPSSDRERSKIDAWEDKPRGKSIWSI